MKKFFDSKPVGFAVMLIVIYVIGLSNVTAISTAVGVEFLAEAVFAVALSALILIFAGKNGLMGYLGLCKPQIPAKDMLFYLPLVAVGMHGIYFGVGMEYGLLTTVLRTVMMLCVGLLEEVIFRGFLFKAIARTSVKRAVLVSALTFAIGHIVNLFNGQDLFETVIQIIFAVAFGFMVVFIFVKSESIIPCVLVHSAFDCMSAFNKAQLLPDSLGEMGKDLVIIAITGIIIIAYTIYVAKLPEREIKL